MAIHRPGEKFRYHRLLSRANGKREMVASLSLTAMVDMFTVLVIFLLQNYSATGEIIYIPKEITLPKATEIKELKPSVVVTISRKELLLDKTAVITFDALRAQEDWLIQQLSEPLKKAIEEARLKHEAKLGNQLRNAVAAPANPNEPLPPPETPWSKVTVQADKGIDFLTVKKVMYTVTEAGASEINFAVMKREGE
jgi:biopolymer transport protein ExbD